MAKVQIGHARVSVGGQFVREGSVLAGTIRAEVPEITSRLEIESDDDPRKVAAVLRAAENGCYAMQALRNPTPVRTEVLVNGVSFDLGA
jgi:hypothetical protein